MVPNGWLHKQIGEIASIQVGRDLVEDKYSEISTTEYKYPVYSNTVENKGLYGFYNFPEYSGNAITIVGRGVGLGKAFARSPGESFGAIGRLLVLTPKNNSFDVIFLANYINFALRIHNESGGIPQLPGASLSKYFVMLPPLAEQQKIAQILSTWDKAIAVTEQLLANSQQQKKALMQQLLTGKKRLLDENGVRFEGEWKLTELNSLLDYHQPTPYLVASTEYDDKYEIPVLTAGKTFILGYTNEKSGIYQDSLPVIIFDDFTTDSKFVDFPFKVKSSAMKILTAKKGASIKYVFEAMRMLKFTVGGHQRHWISIFSNLVIPIPKSHEQQKIAKVLSTADQEIEALQRKLDGLQQEKKALMQQLLTGKRRVKVAA